MKKIYAFFMVTMMVVCLCACGSSKDTAVESDEEAVSGKTVEAEPDTDEIEETTADTAEDVDVEESAEAVDAEESAEDKTDKAEEAEIEEAKEDESDTEGSFRRLIINSEPCVINGSDGFDNAGFTAMINDTTATYSFKSSSKDVTWTVYILDEEFEDAARYIDQAAEPALEGDGDLSIEPGKYI